MMSSNNCSTIVIPDLMGKPETLERDSLAFQRTIISQFQPQLDRKVHVSYPTSSFRPKNTRRIHLARSTSTLLPSAKWPRTSAD